MQTGTVHFTWKVYLKILFENPLPYKMSCASIAISSERMVLSKVNSKIKFSAICDTLFDRHYVSSEDADKAKEQYIEFLDTVLLRNQETFLACNIEKDRLDTFLTAHIYTVEKFSALWNVMIFAFIMFPRQSNVARGFDINDDIVIENLKTESLKAQRLIYDRIHANEISVHNIVLTERLRRSCLAPSSKGKQILAERKKQKFLSEKEKTKEMLTEEI